MSIDSAEGESLIKSKENANIHFTDESIDELKEFLKGKEFVNIDPSEDLESSLFKVIDKADQEIAIEFHIEKVQLEYLAVALGMGLRGFFEGSLFFDNQDKNIFYDFCIIVAKICGNIRHSQLTQGLEKIIVYATRERGHLSIRVINPTPRNIQDSLEKSQSNYGSELINIDQETLGASAHGFGQIKNIIEGLKDKGLQVQLTIKKITNGQEFLGADVEIDLINNN